MLEQHPSPQRANVPLADSEDQVRNQKASESVFAAFHGHGMPTPPPGIADILSAFVKAETRSIKLADMKNMTPGSGSLGVSAAAGVNLFLSMLTPAQREAAKAGINPLDSAAIHRFEAALRANTQLGAFAANGRASSERFGDIKSAMGGQESAAATQYAANLGRMSGSEFASRLGFTGDQAKEFGQIMQGTTGGFRKSVEDYNKVLSDPSATPEQKAEARKNVEQKATSKKDKDATGKVFEMLDKKSSTQEFKNSESRNERAAADPSQVAAAKEMMEKLRQQRQSKQASPS